MPSGYVRRMLPEFPPPDPYESPGTPPEGFALPAPTAVFLNGPAAPEHDRIADRVLDVRPGLFVVVAPG